MHEASITQPITSNAIVRPPQSYGRRALKRFLKRRLAVIGLVFLVLMAAVVLLGRCCHPTPSTNRISRSSANRGRSRRPLARHGRTRPRCPDTVDVWRADLALRRPCRCRALHHRRHAGRCGLRLFPGLDGYDSHAVHRCDDVDPDVADDPALSGMFRPEPWLLVVIVGVLIWMGTARLVRSQFLSLREREFVDAARALGQATCGLCSAISCQTPWVRLRLRLHWQSAARSCWNRHYPFSVSEFSHRCRPGAICSQRQFLDHGCAVARLFRPAFAFLSPYCR